MVKGGAKGSFRWEIFKLQVSQDFYFLTERHISWDYQASNIQKYFYVHYCPDFCRLPPDFSFSVTQKTWVFSYHLLKTFLLLEDGKALGFFSLQRKLFSQDVSCMMRAQVLVVWVMALNDTVRNFKKSFWGLLENDSMFCWQKDQDRRTFTIGHKPCLLIILCRTSE